MARMRKKKRAGTINSLKKHKTKRINAVAFACQKTYDKSIFRKLKKSITMIITKI